MCQTLSFHLIVLKEKLDSPSYVSCFQISTAFPKESWFCCPFLGYSAVLKAKKCNLSRSCSKVSDRTK